MSTRSFDSIFIGHDLSPEMIEMPGMIEMKGLKVLTVSLDVGYDDLAKKKINKKRKRNQLKEFNSKFPYPIHFEDDKYITSINNPKKNRYNDVLALEKTRVKIKDCENDYINANYIYVKDPDDTYISTQGPLFGTIKDFWKMVWDEKSSVVVMLTDFFENNRQKSQRYWSDFSPIQFCYDNNNILLTVKQEKKIQLKTGILRIFSLSLSSDQTKETRKIYHIHYKNWNDHKTPSQPKDINILINYMDIFRKVGKCHGIEGPPIIHCSAGIGRTGTFIACAICKQKYLYNQEINIQQIVNNLRSHRTGMVQTDQQYSFIYEFLVYLTK